MTVARFRSGEPLVMARIVSSGQFSGSSSGLEGPSDTNRTDSPPAMASISAWRSSVDANQMSPMPRAASSPAILIKRLTCPQLGLLANRMRRPPFTSAAAPTWVLLDRPQPGGLHGAHGVCAVTRPSQPAIRGVKQGPLRTGKHLVICAPALARAGQPVSVNPASGWAPRCRSRR
jgi:hypothetical protein